MIIAHRGASFYRPENTVSAFEYAFELGSDGIELDVQMSSDGEIVVYHDWTFAKITGKPDIVTKLSSSEIKRLDAGISFSEKYKGEKVPFLDEALSAVPCGKMVNIEIKKMAGDERDLEEKMIESVYRSGMKDNVIVSSFNHHVIRKIERLDPEIRTALLFNSMMENPARYAEKFRCYSFHPQALYVNKEIIESLHDIGLKVYPWVVDYPEFAERLFEMGADGIITNIPDLMKK